MKPCSNFGLLFCFTCQQARNQGGRRAAKPPLKNFSLSLEKSLGHSLKILDMVQKILAPLGKLRPSWCPKLVTCLLVSFFTTAADLLQVNIAFVLNIFSFCDG